MELMLEQMPIVIRSLNVGFLQTLKLFAVTLLGAVPLGLVIAFGSMSRFRPLAYVTKNHCLDHTRDSADDTASDYLLFSGSCAEKSHLGRRGSRTFSGGVCFLYL